MKKMVLAFITCLLQIVLNCIHNYDFFLINNSVLVNKDSIPNLLIENSIIPEKNKIPCYDDTFHDGMSTDEIENVFSKILF